MLDVTLRDEVNNTTRSSYKVSLSAKGVRAENPKGLYVGFSSPFWGSYISL